MGDLTLLRYRRQQQKRAAAVGQRVQYCEGKAPGKELWSYVLWSPGDCRDPEKGVWQSHGLRVWKPLHTAQGEFLRRLHAPLIGSQATSHPSPPLCRESHCHTTPRSLTP